MVLLFNLFDWFDLSMIRINTEEKVKVVAVAWGNRIAVIARSTTNFSIYVPQATATTFSFSSFFILLLCEYVFAA